MKKIIYSLVVSAMLLSCSDSDSNNTTTETSLTSSDLVGTWVFKMIDGEELYTNEYFVCRFGSDGGEDYLSIESDDSGSSTLKYTDNTTYRVENDTIYITSDLVELELAASISSGELCGESGDILTYTESVNIQDDVDYNSSRTFAAIRTSVDYSDDIVGLWEGRVIDGDEDEPFDDIRLNFKVGGVYNFYNKESDGSWTLMEQDNVYAILGSLLATQWDEDDDVTAAEFWVTEIDGDTMTWRADREGVDNQAGFDLVRVVE